MLYLWHGRRAAFLHIKLKLTPIACNILPDNTRVVSVTITAASDYSMSDTYLVISVTQTMTFTSMDMTSAPLARNILRYIKGMIDNMDVSDKHMDDISHVKRRRM